MAKEKTQKTIVNQNSYPQDGISEESITQTNFDTFERLPSEFTKPLFTRSYSESGNQSN